MTEGIRSLVRLSAALAARDSDALSGAMGECDRLGVTGEAEEVILQSYLFLGYPLALNAFAVWRELTGRSAGVGATDDWEGWAERGEAVCQTVYGGQYEGLRRNVKKLHPDMERWMVIEGYGKVLGRPGLELATRELAIAALLAVLRVPRQLYSHLRGALHSGAEPAEVEEALAEAGSFMDDEGCREIQEVWGRVRTRSPSPEAMSRPLA
jgi:4-carboxymuconolactone decarboxylase